MRVTVDLLSGLLFAVVGLGAATIASTYRLGTAMQMGPGFFPLLLCGLIALIGISIVLKEVVSPGASRTFGRIEWRPLIGITAAVVGFALLIDRAGLALAILALVVIARFAGERPNIVEMFVQVAVLLAIAAGIFVYGLRIPVGLLP